MDIYRVEKHVPLIYLNNSRDYQVLLRLMTFMMNASRNNADTLKYLNDPKNINSRLLTLLAQKTGFLSNKSFLDYELRDIIKGFSSIVKYKGTESSIKSAINLYLNAINSNMDYNVTISNKDNYNVLIILERTDLDLPLLNEILLCVVPAGYTLTIMSDAEKNSMS